MVRFRIIFESSQIVPLENNIKMKYNKINFFGHIGKTIDKYKYKSTGRILN